MQRPVFTHGSPAGHCGDVIGHRDGARIGADAVEFGIRHHTAKMTKHCFQAALVAEVDHPEVPKENYLLWLFRAPRGVQRCRAPGPANGGNLDAIKSTLWTVFVILVLRCYRRVFLHMSFVQSL